MAKVIHQESGAAPEQMVVIDCREFRSRKDALNRIARELERSAGKTLVFKSPHLMNPDAQLKLARQISSRMLADTSPPRYLPAARMIALFPDNLEHLVRYGGLNERLASVFAGYPIRVPPIRDRKRGCCAGHTRFSARKPPAGIASERVYAGCRAGHVAARLARQYQ